jgi:hypothetical protein
MILHLAVIAAIRTGLEDVTGSSGSTAYASLINVRIHCFIDDAKCSSQREWGWRFISCQERASA